MTIFDILRWYQLNRHGQNPTDQVVGSSIVVWVWTWHWSFSGLQAAMSPGWAKRTGGHSQRHRKGREGGHGGRGRGGMMLGSRLYAVNTWPGRTEASVYNGINKMAHSSAGNIRFCQIVFSAWTVCVWYCHKVSNWFLCLENTFFFIGP